ncbi:uncharacterized protein LOC109850873 [Asparagus officinalis]|uniref:uncharacterized protein LOC109850873 n=1 Tax=Asparagus officinalis TaxID=4686 RepID=UPI00098E52C6|nr:uncharacterized protein LOC109850873 [Asparagus officinalis]
MRFAVYRKEGNGVSTNEEGGCSKNILGKKKKNAIEEVRDGNNVNEESISSSPNPSNDLHTRVKRKASVDAMKNIMGSNKKRKFWTTDEEDVMRKAVSEYGEGKVETDKELVSWNIWREMADRLKRQMEKHEGQGELVQWFHMSYEAYNHVSPDAFEV